MIEAQRSPPGSLMAEAQPRQIIDCPRTMESQCITHRRRHYAQRTTENSPFWVTKKIFCCVRLFGHILDPGISALYVDFRLAGACLGTAPLVCILLRISEALLQKHHGFDGVLASPIGMSV